MLELERLMHQKIQDGKVITLNSTFDSLMWFNSWIKNKNLTLKHYYCIGTRTQRWCLFITSEDTRLCLWRTLGTVHCFHMFLFFFFI